MWSGTIPRRRTMSPFTARLRFLHQREVSGDVALINAIDRQSAVLRASHLLAGLSGEALDEIVEAMEVLHLASGELLFRAGDRSDSLYMVLHGRLREFITRSDGRESVVREAGRGESIGEYAVLTGKPQSATVQAVRDTVLARLSRE